MSPALRHLLGLSALGCLVLFTNLGGPRLWDRDEPRNAGCAVEMLHRGDWVVPMFNGELRTHKPVLTYWLIMSAYGLFGISELGARFWSALLAVGTVLCTYGIGRRLFSAAVGWWAALILLTTLMFDMAAHAATPDSPLLFCCTLATLLFVWDTFADPRASAECAHAGHPGAGHPGAARMVRLFPRWPVAVAMYASMGLATLAKGPVGFVLPTAVLGMFLLIMRLPAGQPEAPGSLLRRVGSWMQWAGRPFQPGHFLRTCWSMRPVTAVLVIAAIALPWYVLVGLRTDGQWLHGFFVEHHLGRAAHPMEGHGGSILFYPLALLVGFFPWSVFAVPTVLVIARRVRRPDANFAGLVLAVCWLAVYLGAFSVARTKLPSYITPCYPGVALLVAWFVEAWASRRVAVAPLWSRLALASLATVGLVALVAVPVAAGYLVPGEESLGLVGLLPLVTAAICFGLLRRQRPERLVRVFAGSAVLLMLCVFAYAAQRVDRHRSFDRLLAAAKQHDPQARIATLEVLEPSWVFYWGQPLDKASRSSTADRGAAGDNSAPVPSSARWGPKPGIPVAEFLAQGTDCFVITTRQTAYQLESQLPDVEILAETPGFINGRDLVLLRQGPAGRGLAHRNRTKAR